MLASLAKMSNDTLKEGLIGLWGVTRLASGNSLKSQACRILVARFLAVLQWLAADFFFALQSKPRRRSSFPELSHLRPTSAREHFFTSRFSAVFPCFLSLSLHLLRKKTPPFLPSKLSLDTFLHPRPSRRSKNKPNLTQCQT